MLDLLSSHPLYQLFNSAMSPVSPSLQRALSRSPVGSA